MLDLDEIEAQLDSTVPYYLPALVRELRQARAELAALRAGQAWQPIDSAPKDGTPVIGFMPTYYQGKGGQAVIVWMNYTDRPGWYSDVSSIHEPSHWMPLPPPPGSENRT